MRKYKLIFIQVHEYKFITKINLPGDPLNKKHYLRPINFENLLVLKNFIY